MVRVKGGSHADTRVAWTAHIAVRRGKRHRRTLTISASRYSIDGASLGPHRAYRCAVLIRCPLSGLLLFSIHTSTPILLRQRYQGRCLGGE